jgi:hypothetical protein
MELWLRTLKAERGGAIKGPKGGIAQQLRGAVNAMVSEIANEILKN